MYVYKDSMASLLNLVHVPSQYSIQDALNTLSLEELVLIEWRGKFTPQTLLTWHLRDNRKKYAVKVSIPVAVALWRTLQIATINEALQELLADLTRQLINNGLKSHYLTFSDYA